MTQDFLFFLGVLLMIFAIWVGAGGPNNPVTFDGPFLAPIGSQGTSTWGSWGGTASTSISGDASPYRGRITLSRDTLGARRDTARDEYVTVRASYGTEPVSLAGWQLVSASTKKGATLPSATTLPKAGKVNDAASVTLAAGEEAIITTGRSPIGTSFRENLCTGYFEEHQDFAPPLSLACPSPSQEFTRFSEETDDDSCAAHVRSIAQCGTETRSSADISSSCETFIERRLSYDGCVASHKDETGFAGRTWRLFLGESKELWKNERETILLLDAQGKTVDALTY